MPHAICQHTQDIDTTIRLMGRAMASLQNVLMGAFDAIQHELESLED